MAIEMDGLPANSGAAVPLGSAALVIGTVMILAHFASRSGLIGEAPPSVFPVGIALFVSGYIASFALRRLYKRIQQLEDRITAITQGIPEQRKRTD